MRTQQNPLTPEEIEDITIDLRLEWGDTDEYFFILQDSDYARLIKRHYPNGYRSLSREVGQTIGFKMAHGAVRERVGQEERYGKEAFDAFMELLNKKLKDPSFGAIAPMAYFGGTYRDVTAYYATDPKFTWQPFYQGSETGVPTWRGHRIYKINGEVIEPYEGCQNL